MTTESVEAALRECDMLGFDRRHDLNVMFLVETDSRRDAAYIAASCGAQAGWDTSLFGDASGWVVRFTSSTLVTRAWLARGIATVTDIAEAVDGTLRGYAIEDLGQLDAWDTLAASVTDTDVSHEEGVSYTPARHRGLAAEESATQRSQPALAAIYLCG